MAPIVSKLARMLPIKTNVKNLFAIIPAVLTLIISTTAHAKLPWAKLPSLRSKQFDRSETATLQDIFNTRLTAYKKKPWVGLSMDGPTHKTRFCQYHVGVLINQIQQQRPELLPKLEVYIVVAAPKKIENAAQAQLYPQTFTFWSRRKWLPVLPKRHQWGVHTAIGYRGDTPEESFVLDPVFTDERNSISLKKWANSFGKFQINNIPKDKKSSDYNYQIIAINAQHFLNTAGVGRSVTGAPTIIYGGDEINKRVEEVLTGVSYSKYTAGDPNRLNLMAQMGPTAPETWRHYEGFDAFLKD